VTFMAATGFVLAGVLTVVACWRWTLGAAPGSEPLRAAGLWLLAFVLMQSWSFYLKVGKP
jgi:hypothetical protein